MAWNDADEIVVAQSGSVNFAPVGTTLPAEGSDPDAALAAAFVGAGFINEDGATLSVGSDVQDFKSWQSRQATRREKQDQPITLAFAIQQWNETNLPFAFGGGQVVANGSVYTYEFPADTDPLDERSLVVDWNDGDKHYRSVWPRGNVTEAVESKFARSTEALLPITFSVLAPVGGGIPGYIITDDPAFVAGS